MKTIYLNNQKRIGLLICLMYILSTQIMQAQNRNTLIEFVEAPTLNQQQNKYAQAWIKFPYVMEYAFCRINIQHLQNETIQLDLVHGKQIFIQKRNTIQRTGKMFSWFGNPQSGAGNINFVVNDQKVTGWIFCNEGTYYIYPIGDGLHIMFNCLEDGISVNKDDVDKNNSLNKIIQKDNIDAETGVAKTSAGGDCKLRVAVCYTDDVVDSLDDVASFIQQCIDVTNEILLNSDVHFEVELARSYENSYVEPLNNVQTLNEWNNLTDGILDEISIIRAYYDADVNVLIVSNIDSACGRATTDDIATSANNFCSLQYGCATGNQYTFPHEIAHLLGCNHDPYITGDLLPYSYGHGKTNPFDAGGWRTVMAYKDYCDDIGLTCGRIPYFSNPDIDYEGVSTGTPFALGEPTSDNAQVLNNTVNDVASIEVTLNNKTLPSENIYAGESGDVIAHISMTHLGDYAIHSGGSMTFRSGEYIMLSPGFLAEEGSSFSAYIDGCEALRLAAPMEDNAPEETESFISIYPNPNVGIFTVDFTKFIYTDTDVQIKLFDTNGKLVWQKAKESKTQMMHVNVSHLPKGIYSIAVYSGKEVYTNTIVIQ